MRHLIDEISGVPSNRSARRNFQNGPAIGTTMRQSTQKSKYSIPRPHDLRTKLRIHKEKKIDANVRCTCATWQQVSRREIGDKVFDGKTELQKKGN